MARKIVYLALDSGGIRGRSLIGALVFVALALRSGKRRLHSTKLFLEVCPAGLFHRQQIAKLGDLGIELLQCGVLALHFLLQVELNNDENAQQKNDAEDQCRQRIDESRPVVHAAVAAVHSCERHDLAIPL